MARAPLRADAHPIDALAFVHAVAARPRPAGGAAEDDARAVAAALLAELGFHVTREPFTCSAWPGRYATPVAGAVSGAALALAARAGRRGRPGTALATLATTAVAGGMAAGWLARHGTARMPLSRVRLANLVAVRGKPRVWLVAHLDSKSQPVPMLMRAGAIAASGALWAGAAALAAAQLLGARVARAWSAVGAAGLTASLPVAATTVGAVSPGALDNASGMAAALIAASLVPEDVPLGVLFTSGEELGLAGARAWVRGRVAATAINFDGVDDVGQTMAMYTGPAPRRVLAALERAAAPLGHAVRSRRMIPGILTDSVALADAGWSTVTLSRGDLSTLGRIHTPRDTASRLTGAGIASVARIAARAAEELAR